MQIPSWDARLFDLSRAAESTTYCDEVRGILADAEVELTELSTHLQGQLVAVHPAYDIPFDGFAAPAVRGNPAGRTEWATQQLTLAAKASKNLGLTAHATFSGALAWPYIYPWPQRPAGLIETAFDELARRWRPILDAFDAVGVDVCYEIHPGEDLHDGVTYEMFLQRVDNHPRANLLYDPSHFVLQQLDYLGYIDEYHERIRMFHVKDGGVQRDCETGRVWRVPVLGEPRRPVPQPRRRGDRLFRHLQQALAIRLRRLGGAGMGMLHQGCGAGAAEGAPFIEAHIIEVAKRAFDDSRRAEWMSLPTSVSWGCRFCCRGSATSFCHREPRLRGVAIQACGTMVRNAWIATSLRSSR